jgi:hypothetical protein
MPVAAGAKLPVESLPAGVYRLEVIAFDPSGKQIKQATDFELK